ncbi:uncharacterized protein BX663DRAFT_496084, partial [Cokeromyces recurvatus]|uniref:uncharacterized protein n=1 Tax=Cokeromyces recurvatus TaxID=90255 RepID=UPI00221FACAD
MFLLICIVLSDQFEFSFSLFLFYNMTYTVPRYKCVMIPDADRNALIERVLLKILLFYSRDTKRRLFEREKKNLEIKISKTFWVTMILRAFYF